MGGKFSHDNKIWNVEPLWELSKDLPVFEVAPNSLKEWNIHVWSDRQSLGSIAEHTRRINEADLNCPIILSAEGHIMDGCHRLIKAYLSGVNVKCVQFEVTPPHDRDIKTEL